MINKGKIKLISILSIILLFSFSSQATNKIEMEIQKYYFTMYPTQKNETPYILYANNPYSDFLTINTTDENGSQIKKESTNEYTYQNISSVLLYKNEYLVKTCFGPNKLVEVISQKDLGSKKETQEQKYLFNSENILNDTNSIVFCYTSIIKNPDNSLPDKNAIITFWSEINTKKLGSEREYFHKYVLFYPETKRFSNTFSPHSDFPADFPKIFPKFCTTFRETDIYCTISEEKNQFVLETDKHIIDSVNKPSIYLIRSELKVDDGKNLKPIALNKEYKSIFGGYYDTFLVEYHNETENKTSLIYSLYRKNSRFSLVPIFGNLNLFQGISIKDNYIGHNFFNFLYPYSNEAVLIFLNNNMIHMTRVNYSSSSIVFKNFTENIGSYSTEIGENCKIPKMMKSTYIKNYINYDNEKVNDIKKLYLYRKDISVLLSCANSEDDKNSEVTYYSKIIELPQCLNELDSINGFEYHKMDFYIDMSEIVLDIYNDPKLIPLRNKGIIFHFYEKEFLGLIDYQIILNGFNGYVIPLRDHFYKNITHIKFIRKRKNYVPIFRKKFFINYHLFDLNSTNGKVYNISSNLCSFQMRFFPWKNSSEGHEEVSDTIEYNEDSNNNCNISFCSFCPSNKTIQICEECDTSIIESLVLDKELESKTYGKCICDSSLGFMKEPNSEFNMCICQEDYYYYNSTEICWPKGKLENGPYYEDERDDLSNISIYKDCYYTCAKCSKGGDENNHNCLKCKDGFAYIDNDTSNCYDINDLGEGYHQVEKDHFIKCHNNCISCTQKSEYDKEKNETKEFCTECKNYVPFMLKNSFMDESFNCLERKCDSYNPSLIYAYNENSYQCFKNCENGVQPYNSTDVCWESCSKDFSFLDKNTKKCYDICNKNENNVNVYTNYETGLCMNNCLDKVTDDKICYYCDDFKQQFKNKDGICTSIPRMCLTVDPQTGLCTKCNEGFYPLKEDLNKYSFNCYEKIEEVFESKNKTNYYFNDTGKYWDECYEACLTCNGYGSENRQRCTSCKPEYHYVYYFENNYHNCRLNLSSYDNCTSNQEDIYKYKDFCHFCQEGYSFVYNTDKCMLDEELKNKPFYEDTIKIKKDYNHDEEIEVKIYYPCHKNCKSCTERGDFYDNKCTKCKKGYKFDIDNKNKTCIIDLNYTEEEEKEEEEEEEEKDDGIISIEDIWFKLGNEIFYIYQQDNCIIVFYEEEFFLISNKNNCESICPNWNNNIKNSNCKLKQYKKFENMTREQYNNLINKSKIYDDIKENVNIIIPKNNMYFHLTNFVTKSPNYLSSISLGDYYSNKLKTIYNISLDKNLLLFKVDIKRSDTQSTQVEYQFYNPENIIEKIDLNKLNDKRRLDGEEEGGPKIKIDLPVDWTDDQIKKIDELSEKGVNAFNSSSDFYLDNCNQYTTQGGNDIFLDERKKDYYPDITLCEDGCKFEKYNNDTKKVTCNCNYKTSTDNYDKVTFVKNDVDEKFEKKNFLENLQSMKCISKIFKSENLKKNPGFIIMILFIIIFGAGTIFYFVFGGYYNIKKLVDNQFKDENIRKIFKDKLEDNKQNLFNNENEGDIIKFEEKDNNLGSERKDLKKEDNNPIKEIKDLKKSINSNNSKGKGDKQSETLSIIKNEPKIDEKKINMEDSYDNDENNVNGLIKVDNNGEDNNPNEKMDSSKISSKSRNVKIDNPLIDKSSSEKSSKGLIDKTDKEKDGKPEEIDKELEQQEEEVEFERQKIGIAFSQNPMDNVLIDKEKDNENKGSEDDVQGTLKIDDIKQNPEKTDNGQKKEELIDLDNSSDMNYKLEDFTEQEKGQEEKKEKEEKESDKESNYRIPNKDFDEYSNDLSYNISNPPLKQINQIEKEFASTERKLGSEEKSIIYKSHSLPKKKPCCCLSIKNCLLSSGEKDSEKTFMNIYISDLKKHHIIIYTFFNWFVKDSIFLRLSFFSFSVHLYFGLNTILIFNSSVSDAYYNTSNSSPIYIVMNLLLPFVICGLISFIIKINIMPQFLLEKIEKKIKDNEKLIEYMNQEIGKKEEVKQEGNHKSSLSNKKKDEKEEKKDFSYCAEYYNEKNLIRQDIDSWIKSYKTKVIIYHIVCFIILAFNWYMMTSFCSIYRNTGIKLIVNSFISLAASFVIPFILGLIPTFFGFLAFKTGNRILKKIYEIINFII